MSLPSRIARAFSTLCLSVIGLSLCASVSAATVCCKCHATSDDPTVVCLTGDGPCNAITQLNYNPAIAGVQCVEQIPGTPGTAPCAPVSGGGVCTVGPTPASTYTPGTSVIPTPAQGPATSAKTEKLDQTLKLEIPIPGVTFSNVGTKNGPNLQIPWLAQYITAVYRYIMGISIIAAAVAITYGGFLYVIGSSITSIQTGKKVITDAIIGLFLVFGIYTIISAVSPNIVNLKSLEIARVKTESYESSDSDAVVISKDLGGPAASDTSTQPTPPVELPPLPETAPPSPADQTYTPPPISSSQPTTGQGCQYGTPTQIIPFDWIPKGQSTAAYPPNQGVILVPGAITNCPGSYPVILWLHGNNDAGVAPKSINDFKNLLDNLVNAKKVQPTIIVIPVSKGKNNTLFPGMTWPDLRDAALQTIQANQSTNGITFSSVSVGGHSGIGCNKLWTQVNSVTPYALVNADTCFGIVQEAKQSPQKMIIVVANMYNVHDYRLTAQALGMKDVTGQCGEDFQLVTNARPSSATPNCMKTPEKDWTLLYVDGRNHGKAPGQAMEYALRKFFPAQLPQS